MTAAPYTFWAQEDYVPSEWYLFEALLWISDQRIPYGDGAAEWYLDDPEQDDFRNIPPDLSCSRLLNLESDFTEKAGIGPCPMMFHHAESHVRHIEEKIIEIERFLKSASGNALKTYKKQIQEFEDLLYDRSEWLIDLESYLDEAKTKLFMLLRTGEIIAYGAKLPTRSMTSAKRYVEEYSFISRTAEKHKIPSTEWSLSNALWTDCALQTNANTYAFIYLNRDDLMRAFRPIFKGPINGGLIDGYMVTDEESTKFDQQNKELTPPTKTGRPAYNWDAFHLEVTRQIVSGTLPTKQMADVPLAL